MIIFLTHITSEVEVARLPYIRRALEQNFVTCRLEIINQSGIDIPNSMPRENIKSCGFGWTLRFLRHAEQLMKPEDLMVKIDPDIEIKGNPFEGISVPQGACVGQIKLIGEVPVFLGGFQGFTSDAIRLLLDKGPEFENEEGRQDPILYRIGASLGMDFIALPWVDLWAERNNYDPNSKIISWKRD